MRFQVTYRVVLAASIGVAAVFAFAKAQSRDGQIHTIFEPEARRQLARAVRVHIFDYRLIWSYFDGP